MKITVITPTLNSATALVRTLRSVRAQSHPSVQHIIVDGQSSDDTVRILRSEHDGPWISEPDTGLYEAINKGLEIATGSVIGVLGAGDVFATPGSLRRLTEPLHKPDVAAVYSDLVFVRPTRPDRVVRYYSSRDFRPGMFLNGFMPAHPTFYARSDLLRKLGGYRADYRICADYELLLRFMLIHNYPVEYVRDVSVIMQTGGVSNASMVSRLHLNREMVRACCENGINAHLGQMSWKYTNKVRQFLAPRLPWSAPGSRTVDSSWMN